MSNHENEELQEHTSEKKEMTRRQFLAYTLGGTTAFLAVVPALPMVRFAIDTWFQKKTDKELVKTIPVSEVTNEPTEVRFKALQKDGWYESTPEFVAWVSKDAAGNVFALSPICKHLGCTVKWNLKGLNEYDCPCHDARYTKEGKQLAIADEALDEYYVEIIDDHVYIGGKIKNTRA